MTKLKLMKDLGVRILGLELSGKFTQGGYGDTLIRAAEAMSNAATRPLKHSSRGCSTG